MSIRSFWLDRLKKRTPQLVSQCQAGATLVNRSPQRLLKGAVVIHEDVKQRVSTANT